MTEDQELEQEKKGGMTKISFSVPTPLLGEIHEMAEAQGYTRAEFYRLVLAKGLGAMAEEYNKVLVNKQLRGKTRNGS